MELINRKKLSPGIINHPVHGGVEIISRKGRECRECGGLWVGRRCQRCGEDDQYMVGDWVYECSPVDSEETEEEAEEKVEEETPEELNEEVEGWSFHERQQVVHRSLEPHRGKHRVLFETRHSRRLSTPEEGRKVLIDGDVYVVDGVGRQWRERKYIYHYVYLIRS